MDCLAVWVLLNEEQGRVLWLNCQKRKQNITKKSPIFGPNSWLGTGDATKTDELSEKFQTAFDPPHFRKIMLQYFSKSPI